MVLADLPAIFIMVGIAAYAVLAGADFGAGAWTLLSGSGEAGRRLRDHARHSIGPVWEANHVWLIFILVICWTAYPTAFGSITSTLGIPLYLAAIGIILRGSAYALRGPAEDTPQAAPIERLFGLSSILTPFALGTVIGGIASARVPVGNSAGHEWSSWLNPTSVLLGVLFVATSAYLAAVYLAADARRLQEPDLERGFRLRALGSGIVAGGLALAGLLVIRSDARPIWDGLTSGVGVAALVVSGLAGMSTIVLVWRARYEAARAGAAIAVAAIVAGWAIAQQPRLLPGLTVDEAAAPDSTLVALIIGVGVGLLIVLPSLALLFRLLLRGAFDPVPPDPGEAPASAPAAASRAPRHPAALVLLLLVGAILTVLSDSIGIQIAGIVAMLTFIATMLPRVAVIGAGDAQGAARPVRSTRGHAERGAHGGDDRAAERDGDE
jgi:cytochrome d ubiquinol oxidase subunit II